MRRLDQLLSSIGYASRREVQTLVKDGRIHINGVLATRSDVRVDPATVTFDGEPLEAPDGLIAILHKPLDYVCSRSEDEGATIYDLLPPHWSDRNPPVTSVGRLDKDTTGVLIITDIGPLVQRYTSPRAVVEKVYEVTVDKDLDPALIPVFASGTIMLRSETKPCLPATLNITGLRTASLTITEGRYHQVRRMFASQGYHVEALHRSRFADYTLDDLEPGEWRLVVA
ncbi:MAG TPA: pseudouridine synthase [Prosthecobacter sp.]|nr:pseudouridine synthase [Prosthecobacter sp.]